MYGNLFVYDEKRHLLAFETGLASSSRCLILLGGLTDGLLSLSYFERLSTAIGSLSEPFTLIQPLLRSSNLQYGWHTIDDDIEDLQTLIDWLEVHRKDFQSIVLMGHSTGCQDIVHYLRQGKQSNRIDRVILQGPVSDRQFQATLPYHQKQMEYCKQNKQNPKEWLPRSLHDPPLTIERCLSLNQVNSIEDLFSSDLTDEQLKNIYANIHLPIMWICAKKDEYVPEEIRQDVESFVRNKLAMNKNNSKFVLLEKADHAVNDEHEQIYMIEQIISFIQPANKESNK